MQEGIRRKDVAAVLDGLSEDTTDFWVDYSVPVLENVTMAAFMREGLARYHPVILRGLIDDWPALSTWSDDYLSQKVGDKAVSINLTPDGRADSVQRVEVLPDQLEERFVYPADVKMTLKEFFFHFNRSSCPFVPYLSQQNDNLRTEYPELLDDVAASIPLMDEALGSSTGPEAVNLWIGDERSASSMHKDHFENMYAVISGAKTFTLFPPTDIAFLPTETFLTARYVAERVEPALADGTSDYELSLTTEGCPEERLEWIPIDPNDREDCIVRYPRYRYARPLQCTVYPGEVLYLPAMWYHRVSQTMKTVAVNYWYDMRFDFSIQRLTTLVKGVDPVEDQLLEDEENE
eukprot:scaffold2708_cov158-Ochromonas_danica.AAC.5